MKTLRPSRPQAAGFTLVEIMIVVLIIGILLAIAIPNFVNAREQGRAKSCVATLKQIDSATQQWCMDSNINAANYGAGPTMAQLTTATTGYLRAVPVEPEGGAYTIATSITAVPTCSIAGQGGNYALGAKWAHAIN